MVFLSLYLYQKEESIEKLLNDKIPFIFIKTAFIVLKNIRDVYL